MNILFLDISKLAPQKGGIARVISSLRSFFETQSGENKTYLAYIENHEGANDGSPDLLSPFQLPDNTKRSSLANQQRLEEIIIQYNIDYIINNTLPDMDMIKLCKKVKDRCPDVRLISLMHSLPDYVVINQRIQISRFTDSKQKKLKPFLRWLFKDLYLYLLGWVLTRRYRMAYASSDAVVLLSASYFSTFKRVARLKSADKLYSIANPIDNSFAVTPLPANQKKKQIVYVGRIDKEKSVDRLIFIWEKLSKRLNDWSLIIIGDGPLRNDCEELAGRLQLERINFLGFRYPVEYINESSVLCLTSSFEGFGLVLTEAMTLGTIPFSFGNYGAVYDIIDDQVNGVIVPAYDLDKYADIIYMVATDEKKRFTMSLNAIEKAKQFSLDVIGHKWLGLVEKIESV